MGALDAARRELELAVVNARERSEAYEVALALDGLARIAPLDPRPQAERDAILKRLGVVYLPSITGLAERSRGSSHSAALSPP
jgi:hypothetical protein